MDALYSVSSLGDPADYPDALMTADGRVELWWFCTARPHPIAPYNTLICDEALLDAAVRQEAHRFMDEYFTHAELQLLRPYLRQTYGQPIHEYTRPVPMDVLVGGQCIATSLRSIVAQGGWRLIEMAPAADPPPIPLSAADQRSATR